MDLDTTIDREKSNVYVKIESLKQQLNVIKQLDDEQQIKSELLKYLDTKSTDILQKIIDQVSYDQLLVIVEKSLLELLKVGFGQKNKESGQIMTLSYFFINHAKNYLNENDGMAYSQIFLKNREQKKAIQKQKKSQNLIAQTNKLTQNRQNSKIKSKSGNIFDLLNN